jgi:hypothetical protein
VRTAFLVVIVAAGIAAVGVSGYWMFRDWASLSAAYARFETLAMSASDMRSLFIAEAHQNAFRINCFAEGVGVLLGGILAAIGIHGLCLLPSRRPAETGRGGRDAGLTAGDGPA